MKANFTKLDFQNLLKPNGDCLEWTKSTAYGYGQTNINGKTVKTHRLAMILEGYDVEGFNVLHSCDNPLCCNPKHLRLGNQQDNMRDMYCRGRDTTYRGSSHNQSKLSESQVLDIRADYATGNYRQIDLCRKYQMSSNAIFKIINRKTWTHI